MIYLEPPGERIEDSKLRIPRVRDLWEHLQSKANPYVAGVEVRKSANEAEILVIDVQVEVPQVRAFPIAPVERLAVVVPPDDRHCPDVLALRPDFPWVPHTNLRESEFPRSLCMFDLAWEEQRVRLAPARFVEWLREWLRDTAAGRLHRDNQPLEPTLLETSWHLVLPSEFFRTDVAGSERPFSLFRTDETSNVLVGVSDPRASRGLLCYPIVINAPPQVHGRLQRTPVNLSGLSELCSRMGVDLVANLGERFTATLLDNQRVFPMSPVFILRVPQCRKSASEVPERVEIWAFAALSATVGDVATALGIWAKQGGTYLRLVGQVANPSARLDEIQVCPLRPSSWLTQEIAMSNSATAGPTLKATLVGVGALGSQVIECCTRAGFGLWRIIDSDILLPHNLCRHALDSSAVGYAKVLAVAALCNSILETPVVEEAIVGNVLKPAANQADIHRALTASDLIVDCSASVAVARYLSQEEEGRSRIISLFLNPSGSDLVAIAEDKGRTQRLDLLEMQYYAAIARTPELQDHLRAPAERIRYSRSCRDISSVVPGHAVTMFAGIASRALQRLSQSASAAIEIWRSSAEGEVTRIVPECSTVESCEVAGWKVAIPSLVLGKLRAVRANKLPSETGGVLVGHVDYGSATIYVADSIASPKDSREWPTGYIRGKSRLKAEVDRIERVTDGWLCYIGEWHSHPRRTPPTASSDDHQLLDWITNHLAAQGQPALMLIISEDYRVYVSPEHRNLKERTQL